MIVPANNTVIEPEMYSLSLKNVGFYSTRLLVKGSKPRDLLEMLRGIRKATEIISVCKPDSIAYACLSSSLIKGAGWDTELGKKIESISKIPTVTAASAMLRALKDLRVNNIATVSGYFKNMDLVMTRFLSDSGFRVVRSLALGLPSDEIGLLRPDDLYGLIVKNFPSNAEGLFIGSTDLQSLALIERLEANLKVPVTTVNQALVKYSLKLAGSKVNIVNCGKLLRD